VHLAQVWEKLQDKMKELSPAKRERLMDHAKDLNIHRRIPQLLEALHIGKWTKREEDRFRKCEQRMPILQNAVFRAQLEEEKEKKLPPPERPTPKQEREKVTVIVDEETKRTVEWMKEELKKRRKEAEEAAKKAGAPLGIPMPAWLMGAGAIALLGIVLATVPRR